MIIKIYKENPNHRQLQRFVDILRQGGIIIYPTDTVYALGCDINQPKALDKVALLKGLKAEKTNFSLIFHNLSLLSAYTKQLDNQTFKLIRRNVPGPFTFILEANSHVPKIFRNNKKTIGIRIPDNPILLTLIELLGNPLITTSIHSDDSLEDYITDPELIYNKYKNLVNAMIDGGYGNNVPSTIVDCTRDMPEVIRQGVGTLKD